MCFKSLADNDNLYSTFSIASASDILYVQYVCHAWEKFTKKWKMKIEKATVDRKAYHKYYGMMHLSA